MRQCAINSFSSILGFITCLSTVGRILTVDRGESLSTQSRIRRFENIIKAANDRRSYRGLILDNDLKILLISSPDSERASVAMNIKVGSLNDFEEVPGIAHLVGEMVNRLGTSSNPGQQFVEIINSRLPEDVLYSFTFSETNEDEQLSYFEINSDYLAAALEIFSQFFSEPFLMISNSINPLAEGIQHLDTLRSSFLLGESGDMWQFWPLAKSISAENHPLNHSPCGDTETFDQYLAEEDTSHDLESPSDSDLEPRQTRLHESLDQLERLTVPLFENIPNKRAEKLHFAYEQHPWGKEQLGRKIYSAVNAQSNIADEFVWLVFRVPDIRYQYKTAPDRYMRYILMRGGPGSLVFVLQKRRLCAYFKVSYDVKAGIGFFSIECEVPSNNEMYEDEIVKLILQYIRFISVDGVQKEIFDEINARYNETMFSNSLFTDYVEFIASAMQEYPMEDILSHKYHHDEWRPALIKEFLTYLTPDNMNVFIDSKKFQDVVVEQNTWHKIPYKVEKISDELIEYWTTMDVSSDFRIPKPNEFLVTNWDIYPLNKNEPENPYVIYETPKSRFWFSQDNQSANVRIKFNLIDLKQRWNPSNSSLFCIFRQLLSHLMNEYKYNLNVSGYDMDVTSSDNSGNIHVDGFSDKIQIVLEKIMSKFTVDQLTGSHLQEQFENAKVKCMDVENYRMKYSTVTHHLKLVLTGVRESWSPDEIKAASQSLQLRDWNKFIIKLLSQAYIQGLIMGNCVRQTAVDMAKMIEIPFRSSVKPLPQEMLSLSPRVVEMEGGKHFIDIVFRHPQQQLFFHYTYYQFGTGTDHNVMVSTVLIDMIEGTCVDIIQEDLLSNYCIYRIYGVIGLLFESFTIMQHDANHIDSVIESCLRKILVSVQEMTDFEFEEHAKGVIKKQLDTSASLFWDDIVTGFYNSEQDTTMRPLTKMDILAFFRDTLFEFSPNRRKYTLLTRSPDSDWKALSVIPGTTRIEDLMTFKNDSNLLPLPHPFMRVNL